MGRDTERGLCRRRFLNATGAAGLAAVTGVGHAATDRRTDPAANELLVGVTVGVDDLEAPVAAAAPAEASLVGSNETLGYVTVRFPEDAGDARRAFADRVVDDPRVKYVEPNVTYRAAFTPNDPLWSDQYAPQAVNADDAWDVQFAASSAVVAVVDYAVDCDHPDLDGAFGSDRGHDFVYEDSNPCLESLESDYHGTLVSGVVAAETDNGEGVAGVSESTLLAARAFSGSGLGTAADVADAIEYSADQGAAVINLSFTGAYSDTVKNAVSYAYDRGSLPVAAAGNDGTSGVSYPAAYDECLAVSALNADGSFASYSNYGPAVELCAPGTDVLSTTTESRGSYERASGTSMATAVVSGVAGQVAAYWGVSGGELRRHLKATADDVGLSSDEQGCGRVDAYDAMATDPANSGSCAAGGSCGDRSTTESVSDSLSGPDDSDCWTWNWEYADPCELVIELDGPSDADFDLYLNLGEAECPTTSSYDYASLGTTSDELVTITDPDTSTALYVLVDAYSGSGDYTLTITEKAT